MKKLAIIPARYNSSRFPGKPLLNLLGKTMIQRVYERVVASDLFDKVVVATDHPLIVENVTHFHGEVMTTKESHQNGTERCAEVIATYNDFDIVVNIQGDEPLVDKRQLQALLDTFEDKSVEIATIGTPKITDKEKKDANRIKIVMDKNSNALYFSRSPIPYEKEEVQYPFLRHIGLYGYRSNTLKNLAQLPPTLLEKTESLEQLRWLYYGYAIRVAITEIETPNIDTPEDVEAVLKVLQGK